MVIDNVSLVYDHVTGGRVSKPTTLAAAVIGQYDEANEELVKELMRDEFESRWVDKGVDMDGLSEVLAKMIHAARQDGWTEELLHQRIIGLLNWHGVVCD
jgi:hypothetical protein